MGNVYMEASQINYRGGEKKMSVEEALKNASGEAAAIAQLQADVVDLNDVKANQITIAPAFDAETAYDPGDLVYYNGLSYRCVNAHEGEWDADDFAATTISNELATLMSGLTNLVKFVSLASGQSITVDGSECLVIAKRQHEQTAYDVNAIMYLVIGSIYALVNDGGNTTPITVSYDTTNVTTTITNNNGVAINVIIITN